MKKSKSTKTKKTQIKKENLADKFKQQHKLLYWSPRILGRPLNPQEHLTTDSVSTTS